MAKEVRVFYSLIKKKPFSQFLKKKKKNEEGQSIVSCVFLFPEFFFCSRREQKKNHFSQLVLKGQAAKKRGGIGDSMVMLSFIEYYLNIRSICLHC
jgi:hypothetical protein